jgi:hypothetical protein
VSDC